MLKDCPALFLSTATPSIIIAYTTYSERVQGSLLLRDVYCGTMITEACGTVEVEYEFVLDCPSQVDKINAMF